MAPVQSVVGYTTYNLCHNQSEQYPRILETKLIYSINQDQRTTVEFASCVWDPHERVDINKIEMVQRRGARFVKHQYHDRSSVTDILEDLKWKSLEKRRKESRLTMMYKLVKQQVASDPDKHLMKLQKQSRSANTNSYVVPYASSTSRQQSFFPRTIRDWNQLPLSIKKAGSVSAFKAQLATYFTKLGLPLIPLSDLPHCK